jgi:hypothetical protein
MSNVFSFDVAIKTNIVGNEKIVHSRRFGHTHSLDGTIFYYNQQIITSARELIDVGDVTDAGLVNFFIRNIGTGANVYLFTANDNDTKFAQISPGAACYIKHANAILYAASSDTNLTIETLISS